MKSKLKVSKLIFNESDKENTMLSGTLYIVPITYSKGRLKRNDHVRSFYLYDILEQELSMAHLNISTSVSMSRERYKASKANDTLALSGMPESYRYLA